MTDNKGASAPSNKHNLPDWLYDVVVGTQGEYQPGKKTDYSVTTLLMPSMQYGLIQKYGKEQDIADMLAAFDGTALHNQVERILTQNDRYVCEERFYRDVNIGTKVVTISGQIDLYDKERKAITDCKRTGWWKFAGGDMFDYEAQLNMQRWLMKDYEVERLFIGGFIKDWNRIKALQGKYPPIPFIEHPIPLWPEHAITDFIINSVRQKEKAKKGMCPPCTREERWQREDKWKVFRVGGKRASKVFYNEEEAVVYSEQIGGYVKKEEGEAVRCMNFCPVLKHCPLHKEEM